MLVPSTPRRGIGRALLALSLSFLLWSASWASGPRFVTGPPFFTGPAGVPIPWKQPRLLYFTDPGRLSAAVSHADADALVAQAASAWNLPIANITLTQGGALAEHVSGQNVYLDSAGVVFPADVLQQNASAIPLAVVYDTDGSVIDTLLGDGASDPLECSQNAVLEQVDQFDPAGFITHALLILNGRCTGPAPEQQMEMRYQLMRAFGRVLGLAWSQTNDNVFTGVPRPTYGQAAHWPIMHPIDIVCGPYAFQCLPNPFELRPDDLASMVALYPIAAGPEPPPGKQASLEGANEAEGTVSFPTGQGMAGVNVLVRRGSSSGVDEDWFEASAVTGAAFKRGGSSPFVPIDASALGSQGTLDPSTMGRYLIPYIPLQEGAAAQTLKTSTEPVNPLYTGQYSVGPYAAGAVAPSGAPPSIQSTLYLPQFQDAHVDFVISDAAASCGDGTDGTAANPIQAPPTGWWRGVLCGYGHTTYDSFDVQPGRTFTVEVTALDELGLATIEKALPVIALFAPGDLPNNPPSLGATPTALNSFALGTTTLLGQFDSSPGTGTSIAVGIADQRGDGRPDFGYQARLFYADSISPASIGTTGGQTVINGRGFRIGNTVLINGVPANVTSWTANQLVLAAPSLADAGASDNVAVDVEVLDGGTGATSTMSAALTYVTTPVLPDSLRLLRAPSGSVLTGDLAPSTFAVQVFTSDGTKPVAGASIDFSTTAGSVQFQACGATFCTLKTDASGIASTGVTPLTPGIVTLQAADGKQIQTATLTAEKKAASMQIYSAPSGDVSTSQPAAGLALRLFGSDGAGISGSTIVFSVVTGNATYSNCAAATCTVRTDASGYAAIFVTPTAPGPVTLQVSGGGITRQVQFNATDGGDRMDLGETPPASSVLDAPTGGFSVHLTHKDGTGPAAYERVTFSAPDGILFYGCGQPVCQLTTNTQGDAGSAIHALRAGTFTVQAAYGTQVQTATFTVTQPTLHLRILSAPTGDVPVGIVAKASFAAQLLQSDGVTPVAGAEITLVGAEGDVVLDTCMRATCPMIGDASGIVAARVTALRSGTITLSAVSASLVQTASYQSVGGVETLRILAQPSLAGALVGDPQTLTVQLILPDGITPAVGRGVNFIAGSNSIAFSNCLATVCRVFTDNNGQASLIGTAIVPGPLSVQVTGDSLTQTINFLAFPKARVMHLLSAPVSGSFTGTLASLPFAIQLFLSDGTTPAGNQNVTFAVTNGVASLQACLGASSCALQTDSSGRVASLVTPLTPGPITLTAVSGSAAQAATFTAQERPDTVRFISVPADGSVVGDTAAAPLSLQVTSADGATPRAGVAVTVAVTNLAARLLACGGTSCTLTSDAQGIVSTQVVPLSAGAVSLAALELQPDQTNVTPRLASFQAGNRPGGFVSLNAREASTYLAEGEPATVALHVSASQNGLGLGGQQVLWSTTPEVGLSVAPTQAQAQSPGQAQAQPPTPLQTQTDGTGSASLQATVAPLGAGAHAATTACTLAHVCTDFAFTGVSGQSFRVVLLSGADQQAGNGSALTPLVAMVLDDQGHPVVSAPVNIFQTVVAHTLDCPARGRCPAMPILASQVTSAATDQAGLVSLLPASLSGRTTETRLAVSSGTQGFLSTTLASSP